MGHEPVGAGRHRASGILARMNTTIASPKVATRLITLCNLEAKHLAQARAGLIIRPVKPQPLTDGKAWAWYGTPLTAWGLDEPADSETMARGCPFGKPGEVLWAKEAWRTWEGHDNQKPSEIASSYGPVRYEADGHWDGGVSTAGRFRTATSMPRWASRFDLEVMSVKVVRVHTLTNSDAISAGLDGPLKTEESEEGTWCSGVYPKSLGKRRPAEPLGWYSDAIYAYRELWDHRYGDDTPWARNPWAWVMEVRTTR